MEFITQLFGDLTLTSANFVDYVKTMIEGFIDIVWDGTEISIAGYIIIVVLTFTIAKNILEFILSLRGDKNG